MTKLEVVGDLGLHTDRLSVWRRAGTEAGSLEDIIDALVIATIAGRRELEVDHLSRLVDVEFGDKVEAAHLRGERQQWNEKLDHRRRIVGLDAAAGSGPRA